jgi:glyoxylase-like metal-dependent hydrolase (beta-lactamase superfamily II)
MRLARPVRHRVRKRRFRRAFVPPSNEEDGMRRGAWAVVLFLFVVSCATGRGRPSSDALEPVDRALAAMGGADKVGALEALIVKGSARHWEPEQSVKVDGEPRYAGDSSFVAIRALDGKAARIEWVRKLVFPAPREYRFTEIVTPSAGYVEGIDTTTPTKQIQNSNPPRHAMSGLRLAAALRELERTSPRLLVDMRSDPSSVARAPDVTMGGRRMTAVSYQAGDTSFLVLFDPQTGLPARVRTLDADSVYGDSTYDLVLDDWRVVGGVKFPYAQRYELNGREVVRIACDEVRPNPSLSADEVEIPAALRAGAPRPAGGEDVPFQWVIRRQFIGVYLDSDAVTFDPQAIGGLRLVELAPGVVQVAGGSHNSLVVEMVDHLVVLDAPIGEVQSRWTLEALRARYPGKPVRYLVLSHHHMDHVGGARTYVAQGATVLVAAGNAAHFERMFTAPHRIDRDALQQSPRRAEIVEVPDKHVLTDGRRTVELYRIENPHSEGMLFGYVPDAKLGYVVDLWNPGRDRLSDELTPGQAALVAALTQRGITPQRIAGGHGAVDEYAPLAARAISRQAGTGSTR